MGDVFESSGPERLVAGGIWFLLLMTLGGISSWLWSISVSRTYDAVGYGIFNTAYSLYTFIWVLVFGGLFQGLMKYGSEYLASKKDILDFFSNSIKYMTFIGIAVFLLLSIVIFYIDDFVLRPMIISLALAFLFSGTKDALMGVIGSFQQSKYLSIINSSRYIILLLVGFLMITFGMSPRWFPILLLVMTMWQLGLSVYFIRYRMKKFPFDMTKLFETESGITDMKSITEFKKMAVFGVFISLGMISFNVMKSLDIVILNMFFEYAHVGVYSVADTLSSILFYMTSFSLPIIPAIAEAYSKKDDKLTEDYVKISVKYPILIGVPITIVVLILARPIILTFYGFRFAQAIVPLQILMVGTFMLMFGYNLSSVLVGIGKPKLSGLLMGFTAIQYILSLIILTPMFGFTGAALSLTLTGFTSMLLMPYFLKKEIGIDIYDGLHMVLLSAFLMALFLIAVPKDSILMMIFGIVGGVLIFLEALYLFEYITEEDIERMRIAGGTFKRKK